MSRAREDRLFERFRRRGDPQALAAVFDSTAPELMRVARHLIGDRASAEDLVQATFVDAIEHAGRFDGERRVLPWLLGILANLARDRRRQRARRHEQDVAARPAADDPVAAAERAELEVALHDALRRLREPYAEVLRLSLEHDLTAREIAERLGRPAGTVRTQLVRGLDLLRRALPAGFAASVAVLATPTRGLAAVRSAVLERARDVPLAAAAGAVTNFGRILLMKKLALSSAAALAVAGAVTFTVWRGDAGRRAAPPAEVAGAAANAARAGGSRVEARALDDDTARDPAAERIEVAAREPGAPSALTVRTSRGGARAADVGIYVRGGSAEQPVRLERRTGLDGIAFFGGLPPGGYVVSADRGATRTIEIEPGEPEELLLELPRGTTVIGEVRSRSGEPVAGARIYRADDLHHDRRRILARSDLRGSFRIDGVARGTEIWARAAGHGPSRRVAVAGSPGAEVPVVLSLGIGGHAIGGQVVDEAGRPVAGALVGLALKDPMTEAEQARMRALFGDAADRWATTYRETFLLRADDAGRFSSDESPPGAQLVLARGPAERDTRRAAALVDVAAGEPAPPLVLVLRPGAEVRGVVRDDAGAPLADASVAAEWDETNPFGNIDGRFGALFANAAARSGPDGSFELTGLLVGRYHLFAGPTHHRAEGHDSTSADRPLRWDPVVARGSSLALRAIDARGAPLAGWTIELRAQKNSEGHDVGRATDAEGRCRIDGLADRAYTVSLHAPSARDGAGTFPALVRHDLRPGADEVLLELGTANASGAFVQGRLVDSDGRPLGNVEIELARADWPVRATGYSDWRDGTFRFDGLGPGEYRAAIAPAGQYALELGPWTVGAAGRRLGDVVVAAPARLSIRPICPSGVDLADLQVALEPRNAGWKKPRVARASDSATFLASAARPGPYALTIRGPGVGPYRREILLEAGAELGLDAALRPGFARTLEMRFDKGASGVIGIAFPRASDTGFSARPLEIHNASGLGLAQGAFEIRDQLGDVVLSGRVFERLKDERRIVRRQVWLEPGGYVVKVWNTLDFVELEERFTVTEADRGEPVRLRLRQGQ